MVPRLWNGSAVFLAVAIVVLDIGYWWAYRLPSPLSVWRAYRKRRNER